MSSSRKMWLGVARFAPVVLLGTQVALSASFAAAGAARELCYARTLAEGGGLALQPGAIQSLGFDSLPWVLLLALAQLVGLPLLQGARVLGVLVGAVALYMLPAAAARLEGRRAIRALDLVPGLVLAAHPELARQVAGGLGTSLVLLLLVVSVGLLAEEERRFGAGQRRGVLGSAMPLGLLLLATPIAPVLVLALLTGRVLSRGAARRVCWQDVQWLAVPLVVQVAILVVAYVVFADPLPGLISAREALPETRLGSDAALAAGWRSLQGGLRGWGATAPLLLLALVGALRHTLYWVRFAIAAVGLAAAAAVLASGGDPTGRWLVPAVLSLVILAGSGFASVLGPLRRLLGGPRLRVAGVAAVALGLLAGPGASALRTLASPPRSPHHREQQLVDWLRGHVERMGLVPSAVTVLTDRPGAMALHGFRVVDATGVTDPAVRRHNGLRHPLELGQLVRERRPDVLVERRPWRHVHNLGQRPEVCRSHFPARFVGQPAASIRIARRLVLESAPWPDRAVRRDVGGGLLLLGARSEPGALALLWMAVDNAPAQRHVRVGVGPKWSVDVPVGPALYPMRRWRAGEVVRQRLPVPPAAAGAGQPWIEVDDERVQLQGVNPELTRLEPAAWYRRRLDLLARGGRQDAAEAMVQLWREPRLRAPALQERVVKQMEQLVARGLLREALVRLRLARLCGPAPPALHRVAQRLGERARREADRQQRLGNWPAALSHLRVAATVRPGSAWLARRLEDARARQPATNHLVRVLELELARRAQALSPSPAGLARVLQAHLDLGGAEAAVTAWHAWREGVPTDRRGRLLFARALARAGQPWAALEQLDRLLDSEPQGQPLSRRCPPDEAIVPRLLARRLRGLLGVEERQAPAALRFAGEPEQLGAGAHLLASCVRWTGRRVRTTLYLRLPRGRDLPLELSFGTRRHRLLVAGEPAGLRRVTTSLLLPPASYRVRLRADGGDVVPLGRLAVGPEASFGFELPSYEPWNRRGRAFGEVPVVGRGVPWRVLVGYEGERYADSFVRGFDAPTGSLLSPPFTLRRSYLMLLVAGGDQPKVGVDLLVDGRVRRTVRGRGQEVLRLHFIPVARYRGRLARVQIRDGSARPWGHLAVDEIRQVDGPAPGVHPGR